ncbi:large subunit ribosomal protein L32 [Entomortierella parvispora]|uniref:Large ribosomal subunit protein bL32m n=1 Tax=Entomortierella parvispora TaxID=205924 RepID=A0A9P3H7Y1_9FUNG|nr:large subunit ribosomal protein L32 [Entomortierella parvispora]
MSSLARSAARATVGIPARTAAFSTPVSSRTFANSTSFNTPDASSSPALSTVPSGVTTTALGRLSSYISDLIPSIVWASVPKSKTSHSKKRMRQATKGLQPQKNIVQCPGCGQAKLMHHLCTHCYRDMKGRGPSSTTEA